LDCSGRLDRTLNTTLKGYILKQILTLLIFCLLFSPIALSGPRPSTANSSIPQTSPILESPATADYPVIEVTPPIPDATATQGLTEPLASPTASGVPALPVAPGVPTLSEPPAIPEAAAVKIPSVIPNSAIEINTLANYQLAPGDTLNISVWKEEGLQEQQYLISPDGTIIFPLIGTVLATGKTITELKDQLATKLSDFISDPSVTVKLINNQGNSIFVIGKVNKPGQVFSGRKIDVLQALSLAGGLTVFADADSISVLRRVGNETKVFPFDYSDVIKGEDLQQNIMLEPGDTVTVP
jgi:polysaccharide export outer membrane protein